MKRFLFSTGILFSVFIHSQSQTHSTVFPYPYNVLYHGLPMELSVGLPGIEADSVLLSAINAQFEKIDNWHWIVTPDTLPGTRLEIHVTCWNKRRLVLQDSWEYRLIWIPDPVIYFGNVSSSNESVRKRKEELLEASGIFPRMEHFDIDVKFSVISYNAEIISGHDTTNYSVKGPVLSSELRSALATCKSGDQFRIENVKVKGIDQRIRILPGPTITIL